MATPAEVKAAFAAIAQDPDLFLNGNLSDQALAGLLNLITENSGGGGGGVASTVAVSNFPATSLGATNDAPAGTNDGDFSLSALFKRFLLKQFSPVQTDSTIIAAIGPNTIISAPGAGLAIRLLALRIQNTTDTTTTVLVQSGGIPFSSLVTTSAGSGLSETYGDIDLILGEGDPLILNLSVAAAHRVSVMYRIVEVATGLILS